LVKSLTGLILERKYREDYENNLILLTISIFSLLTIFCLTLDHTYSLQLSDSERLSNHFQFVTAIATIIATLLAISFTFTIVGVQFMVTNYDPEMHQYILRSKYSILTFLLFSFMVLFTLMLPFNTLQYLYTPLFFTMFSFGLLYSYYNSISRMLNAKLLFKHQKNICKESLCEYAQASDEMKQNKALQKVESSFYSTFRILAKESHAVRIETVQYGIKILSNMLRSVTSEEKITFGLLNLFIYRSSELILSNTPLTNELSEGLLKALGDSIQLVSVNDENSMNMRKITLEIGFQMKRMVEVQNTAYLYTALGLLPGIVTRFSNTAHAANMVIQDALKKIKDPELIIIESLLNNLSLLLRLNIRTYPQNYAQFYSTIVSTLDLLHESTLIIRRKRLDEVSCVTVLRYAFGEKSQVMAFVPSFLLSTAQQKFNTRYTRTVHFRTVINSLFSILRSLLQYAIKFEMFTSLLPFLSKNLIDLIIFIKYSGRLNEVPESTFQEMLQLSDSIDNLLLSKDSSFYIIYLNQFSKQIRQYLIVRYSLSLNESYLKKILLKIWNSDINLLHSAQQN
jgi:hypothetical protein